MLTARNSNKESVIACKTLDKNDTYYCPECGNRLVFKNGDILIPHFAHKTNVDCSYHKYSKGESDEHIKYKHYLYNIFNNIGEDGSNNGIAKMEYKVVPNRIADIYVEMPNKKEFVIEIQHSKISINEFIMRTLDYNEKGIPVWWIFDSKFILDDYNNPKNISQKDFFRYLMDSEKKIGTNDNSASKSVSMCYFIEENHNTFTLYKSRVRKEFYRYSNLKHIGKTFFGKTTQHYSFELKTLDRCITKELKATEFNFNIEGKVISIYCICSCFEN